MPEENNFEEAMGLLKTGRRKEASRIFLQLYQQTTNNRFKLQILDPLITALDPTQENKKLIDLCSDGIDLAAVLGFSDLQAHFMGRKADFLVNKLSVYQYHRACLKLAPGWIEFSTESDKKKHEFLTKKIEELEIEIDRLLGDAFKLGEAIGNKKISAFILMSKASVESSRYFQYKMDYLRVPWKAKIALLLNRLGYESTLIFGFKHSQVLKGYIRSCIADYNNAAKLLEEINDDGARFAYYNLAVHLKSTYRFRMAKKCLRKAKAIAERNRDSQLLARIKALEASIMAKNRDVPNYIEGETRKEIVI